MGYHGRAVSLDAGAGYQSGGGEGTAKIISLGATLPDRYVSQEARSYVILRLYHGHLRGQARHQVGRATI